MKINTIHPHEKSLSEDLLECPLESVSENAHIFHDLGATSMQYFAIVTALSAHFSLSDYDKGDTYRYTPKEICDYIERHL